MHCFGLPDSMATVLSLLVHCWVPVCVIKDNTICTSKVDSHTTASGGGDEAEDPFVEVESID